MPDGGKKDAKPKAAAKADDKKEAAGKSKPASKANDKKPKGKK
jgi:hypothetical protein